MKAHSIADWIDEHQDRIHNSFIAAGAVMGLVYGILYGLYSNDGGYPLISGPVCAVLFAFYGLIIGAILTAAATCLTRYWRGTLFLAVLAAFYALPSPKPEQPPLNPQTRTQPDIRGYAPLEKYR